MNKSKHSYLIFFSNPTPVFYINNKNIVERLKIMEKMSPVLCMTCVCLFFQLTIVIMNGHFHEKLIFFRPFHLPNNSTFVHFESLQAAYLAFEAGKGQNKKRFISFQGQLGLRNPQAVRKCNCFSPYCAKTPMNFSIQILTIYRTNGILLPKLF